jgi:hypothetical protein
VEGARFEQPRVQLLQIPNRSGYQALSVMGILRGFTRLLNIKQGTGKLFPDELQIADPAGRFPLFFGDADAAVISNCGPGSS